MDCNPTRVASVNVGFKENLAKSKKKIHNNQKLPQIKCVINLRHFQQCPPCVAWKNYTACPLCTAIMATHRTSGNIETLQIRLKTAMYYEPQHFYCAYKFSAPIETQWKTNLHFINHLMNLTWDQDRITKFLKWSSTYCCLLTCVFMESRILSTDDHKTKISINLKLLKRFYIYITPSKIQFFM